MTDYLYRFNPFHDRLGRFATSNSGSRFRRISDDSKTTDKNEKKSFKLSDRQKKALKIGAVAVGTALVAYGGYKLYQSGALDKYVSSGKSIISERLPAGDLSSGIFNDIPGVESLSSSLRSVNPLHGTFEGSGNCSYCGIAGYMRQYLGKDVVAKGTFGEQQLLGGVVEQCFKGAKVLDGEATKFGKSPEDAAEMLLKRFEGKDSAGVVSIQWKPGSGLKGGHVFNWAIKNGKVSFSDFQNGYDDSYIRRAFWRAINPNDALTIARLDNAEIIEEEVSKIVRNR